MTVTWATFLANTVRRTIADMVTGTYRYTDAELLVIANDALVAISADVPYIKNTTLATDGSTYQWDLPADFYALRYLYCTNTSQFFFVNNLSLTTKSTFDVNRSSQSTPRGYLLHFPEAGVLWLPYTPASTDTYTLVYHGAYPTIASGSTELSFTDRPWMYEAFALYIAYLVFVREAGDRARNEQYLARVDISTGNTLRDQAIFLQKQYRRILEERKQELGQLYY